MRAEPQVNSPRPHTEPAKRVTAPRIASATQRRQECLRINITTSLRSLRSFAAILVPVGAYPPAPNRGSMNSLSLEFASALSPESSCATRAPESNGGLEIFLSPERAPYRSPGRRVASPGLGAPTRRAPKGRHRPFFNHEWTRIDTNVRMPVKMCRAIPAGGVSTTPDGFVRGVNARNRE